MASAFSRFATVGDAATVYEGIQLRGRAAAADEVMVTTTIHDPAERRRSYVAAVRGRTYRGSVSRHRERAGAMAAPPTDEAADPRRWKALAVCLVAGFMTLLDVSIVNVALPSIREAVGASSSELQWVVSGYALTFGLVLVPAGPPRRRCAAGGPMFIVGVAVFTLTSLLAGLAPTALLLVVARLVQGVGGGLLNPQVSGLIQELFRGAERGKAFGLLGTVDRHLHRRRADPRRRHHRRSGRRGGLALDLLRQHPDRHRRRRCSSLRLLPAPHPRAGGPRPRPRPGRRRRCSAPACSPSCSRWCRSSSGRATPSGPCWPSVWCSWSCSSLWERRYAARGREPLVDLSLFSLPGYAPGATLALIYFAGFTGIFFVLTLYFQTGLGYSALLAGLAVTPFAAGSAVTAARRRALRHPRRPGRWSWSVSWSCCRPGASPTWSLVLHGDEHAAGLVDGGPLLVAGIGSGLVISPNQTLTLANVPVQRAGSAGGVIQTGQRIGTAAGIALVGSVYFATLSSSHGDDARAAGYGLRIAAALTAVALLVGVLDVLRNRGGGRSAAGSPAAAR